VAFAAGLATKTKTVNVTNDTLVEGDETVVVTLASGSGYTIGSPASGTVTIQDDDGAPTPTPIPTATATATATATPTATASATPTATPTAAPTPTPSSTPTVPVVTVTATDPTAGEPGTGQGTGTFTFSRTGPTTAALTVNFTVGGTATSGTDYNSIGTTVAFAAGLATKTKTVNVINDTLVEGNETVVVTLASGSGYTIGSPASATVRIRDDD
jgi:hypothetical protein